MIRDGGDGNMSEETSRIAARERRVEQMRGLTLMSDTFMSVALRDVPACQYVLRILTGIESLKVKEVRTQYRISKTDSRDAILDVLAEDASGKLYNLEIQRLNTVDHARRTRFYGAMIDSVYLEKGHHICGFAGGLHLLSERNGYLEQKSSPSVK